MELFGFSVRRVNRAKRQEEGSEGTEVRIGRLEAEVRAAREEARQLAVVAQRLEAGELAREAAFSKGLEALRSVLGRISVGRRKSRPPDGAGSGDGDAEHDWVRGYLALRGHAPGAAATRFEADDVTEEGE